MFQADLHCHTTCSDGTLSPEELVRHAQELGLAGLSITDHDTIGAYSVAIPLAQELGMRLGSGVEFSSVFRGMSVHILGYDFDLNSPDIHALCHKHLERRKERNRRIIKNLHRLHMEIDEEKLLCQGKGTIGRPHIAALMVEKGYVTTIRQAFDLYIGDGKSCFDAGDAISSEETIDVIHRAGGKGFIAHPHLLKHTNKIKDLLKLPFDGLECYYAKFPLDQENKWLHLAKEKGWLISGGSDFHGGVKEHIPLGCSWVDEETFGRIFQRRLS